MAFFFTRLMRYALIFYAIFFGSNYLLKSKSYTFNAKEFKTLADKSKGEGAGAVVRFANDLRRSFGPYVAQDLSWSGFQAGGLQLKAMVLHGSLTEFIVAFHAPFDTLGRTGLHFANASCSVLSGTVKRLPDATHSDTVESFAAGGNFRVGQFESSLVSVSAKSYVVCYGRGLIPVSSFWALPQNLLGGDILSTGKFLGQYITNTYYSTVHSGTALFNHVKKTYLKTEL